MPAGVLLLLNLIVFGRILGHDLLLVDDWSFIVRNPCVAPVGASVVGAACQHLCSGDH